MKYQKLLLGEKPYFISNIQGSYPKHCHNEIEIMYCVHGTIQVVLDEKEYTLCEGSILFVSSLAFHQLIFEDDAVVLVIEFGPKLLGEPFNEIAMQSFTECLIEASAQCHYRHHILKLLKKLYQEYTSYKKGADWAIQGYLFQLFAMLVRYVPMSPQNVQKQKDMGKYLKIQRVFELVQTEYQQEITLERAASYVGYESHAFCKLFKSITNMTFHDYLNFYRINISKNLLGYRDYSIGEVGEMTGIPVAKTFSRLFRKYTGMSPSEYRNKRLKVMELE